jgi:hypothetical protein
MLTHCEVLQQVTCNYRHRRLQGSSLFALTALRAILSTSLGASSSPTSGCFVTFVYPGINACRVAFVSLSNDFPRLSFPIDGGNITITHRPVDAFKSPQVCITRALIIPDIMVHAAVCFLRKSGML